MSLNEGVFECDTSRSGSTKKEIGINIYDSETKEDVSDKFSAKMKMPEGVDCLDGCEANESEECFCEDIGIFDVGS